MQQKPPEEGSNYFTDYKWNEKKRMDTIRNRGIDFADAQGIFFDPYIELFSPREGENRWIAVGELDGRFIAVVYTKRHKGRMCRIITARRARDHEREKYRQIHR